MDKKKMKNKKIKNIKKNTTEIIVNSCIFCGNFLPFYI